VPLELLLAIVVALAIWLLVAWLRVSQRLADALATHDEELKAARNQSVRQSRSVLLGKAAEQIAPLLPAFCDRYSPSDARFLGAPIDYVIFDGLADGHLERVVFLEVKSGASASLNANEREVRRAISEGRVDFEVLSLANAAVRPPPVLARPPRAMRTPPSG
jgi:predicted Holliday junction resolvase-like endonuclease